MALLFTKSIHVCKCAENEDFWCYGTLDTCTDDQCLRNKAKQQSNVSVLMVTVQLLSNQETSYVKLYWMENLILLVLGAQNTPKGSCRW